jgi:adenosylcobinamide-GDP ribazoletransferase
MIGFAVGGIWWLADKAWPAAAAAAVALASDVALTGYLHLDGLADAADGILPPLEPDRRLAAMADPAVGAFGIVTVGVVLLLRFGALASTRSAPLVVASLWCGSRTAMAVIARSLPYARPGGLAAAFLEDPGATNEGTLPAQRSPVVPALVGVVLSVCLALAGRGLHALTALGAEFLAAGAVALLSRRRIGGFTGDVLGAAGVIGETVGLLVLAARW